MRRESQPIADLLVEVVSPVLITLLVSSLVCFVVEVLYQGQYNFRLQAILCLFVLGIVGTARISLTDGASYASLFAAPLGIATFIALLRFVEYAGPLAAAGPLISLSIMVGIWWSAHQLTIDSTFVDRDGDPTGAGLLSQLGWETDPREGPAATTATPPVDGVSEVHIPAEEESWWDRWVSGNNRPHTPGTWAFYFSLAALPIFGVGQWFLPADDLAGRRWVMWLAVVYVACALGLLLSTSFLGIRRYLRQRKLDLPLEMGASWLILGGGMIAAIMLVAFLLPRPMPEYSLAQWLPPITSQTRGTSPLAVGKEGVRDAEKQGAGTTPQPQPGKNDAGNQPSSASDNGSGDQQSNAGNAAKGEPAKSGGDSSSNSGQSENGSGSKSGDKGSSGGKTTGKQENDAKDKQKNSQPQTGGREDSQAGAKNEVSKSPSQQQPARGGNSGEKSEQRSSQSAASPASPPRFRSVFANLPDLLNRLGMLIAFAFAACFAWRHREQLRAAWEKLKQEWQALLAKLFGGRDRREPTPAVVAVSAPPPPQPFSSFADPFATGQAAVWPLAELLRYSFAALEAWGREHACERKEGQTPLEYAATVANQQPTVAAEVQQLALIYGQVAYGPASGTLSLEVVRRFWARLRGNSG